MTTENNNLERRLAAILAADIVGYSALVEHDEEATIKAVKALWANILEPTARREGGRIVKTMGDGVLAEFPSAVRAVTCALNIQEATTAGDTAFPDGTKLVLRIGLHLGDIVIDGEDILGDGVNLAARLEGLAHPGGVCISSAVWDQLTSDLATRFSDNGEKSVKNISRRIRVFTTGSASPENAPPPSKNREATDRKPTVAICAFEALTQDDTSKVLAQGCQQTTAAYLSTLTGLTLVSPKANPDYLAEASFQSLGDRYRCVLKLAEAAEERPVLSNRFDGVIDDLFDTQDALSNQIATAVRYAVHENEGDKAAAGSHGEMSLEQKLSRAGTLMMGHEVAGWTEADELLDDYLANRPDEFMALTMKACSLLIESFTGIELVPPETADRSLVLLNKARTLTDRSDFLHLIRAEYHLGVERDIPAARRAIERSLEVTPDYVLAQNAMARVDGIDGHAEVALAAYETIVPLMSKNRILHRILCNKALCLFSYGDPQAALATAQESLERAPDYVQSLGFAATFASAAGAAETAERHMKRLLRIRPGLNLARIRPIGFADPALETLYRGGLVKAGLPEG